MVALTSAVRSTARLRVACDAQRASSSRPSLARQQGANAGPLLPHCDACTNDQPRHPRQAHALNTAPAMIHIAQGGLSPAAATGKPGGVRQRGARPALRGWAAAPAWGGRARVKWRGARSCPRMGAHGDTATPATAATATAATNTTAITAAVGRRASRKLASRLQVSLAYKARMPVCHPSWGGAASGPHQACSWPLLPCPSHHPNRCNTRMASPI